MKIPHLQPRTWALVAAVAVLLSLLVYVALRSGPMAAVAVTQTQVATRAIRPGVSGIGTVEARYSHRIGPTLPGRVERIDVNVGDKVAAGQVLGEMDPVDLDDRILSQSAALSRAQAALREASAREAYSRAQARRYRELAAQQLVSVEAFEAKRQDSQAAAAALAASRAEIDRAQSDLGALRAQRGNVRLIAPVDGIVTRRDADPGTTVVAGQAVLELVDPRSLWVDARFDQGGTAGLVAGAPAQVVLRSRGGATLQGRVERVEPRADAITEEVLAKVAFERQPAPLPPIGELAEVTVQLPAQPPLPVIPGAAVQRQGEQVGVWRIADGKLRFVPVRLGASDLEGQVQVLEGLRAGDSVVLYSARPLKPRSRVKVVTQVAGASP